jgi:hypothetical protein
MTWKKYLKRKQFLAERINVTVFTVIRWDKLNNVPDIYFSKLQSALSELGYELTPTEMRKLNERNNT